MYNPPENQIYHIIYLTTNLVNNKIYVGKHSTYNLEDGYLGSGSNIIRAIKKYVKEKFKREVLYCCLSAKDAIQIEILIVNKSFIDRKDTYNICLGGDTFSNNPNKNKILQKLSIASKGNNNGCSLVYLTTIKNMSMIEAITFLKEKAKKATETKKKNNYVFGCKNSKEEKQQIIKKCQDICREKLPSIIAKDPHGNTFIFKAKENFCDLHNLNEYLLKKYLNKGVIPTNKIKATNLTDNYKNTIGWQFDYY